MKYNPFSDTAKLSPWWRISVVVVILMAFSVLGLITKMAYDNAPPIPEKVVTERGELLFTKEEILDGQALFLKYNLMEHGTIWGHGAYLGPDYSAEYLHQLGEVTQETVAQNLVGKSYSQLSEIEQVPIEKQVIRLLKTNRFDAHQQTLIFTASETAGYQAALRYWKQYFSSGEAPGLPANYITDPKEMRELVSFFAWTAWASVVTRPGESVTYTNNFPFDPLVGNFPSADAYFWSAMSLIFLLGGIGLMLFLFGKFDFLGWDAKAKHRHIHDTHLIAPPVFPSQRAIFPFFVVVGILFLLQALTGGAAAHFRVEQSFYGIPIAEWLPFNLLRTWHLQLAIFWVATAWVASGLFIAPLISGFDPPRQGLGVRILFGALLIVVLGSLASEYLSYMGVFPGDLWFWLGNQGSEYLDLGRAWQYLLIVGFLFWVFLLLRAIRPAFRNRGTKEMGWLFFLSAAAIPIFYVPAVFYDHHTHFTIIDNWRFWIIHLWVEGFFEVFATVMTASIFVYMGVTLPVVAKRVIYLDILLYLGSGVIGTGHHWYFTGQTDVNMALSACFSAMEIIPLTLLTLDAWDFIQVSRAKCVECGHYLAERQRWTIYFLIAVGVWNFVGAGIFGFLINLPVISYFQVGTSLTPNHGHAAMFGVFGMLALALTLFCMRSLQTETVWNKIKPWIRLSFWGLNGGMGLMVLTDLFPAGVLQLWDSLSNGYWHARRLSFLMEGTYHTLEWVRIGADTFFILAGVIPILVAILITAYHRRRKEGEAIIA